MNTVVELRLGSKTDLLCLGVAAGLLALTATRAHVTAPLRAATAGSKLGDLLACPYCVAHWTGLLAALTVYDDLVSYIAQSLFIIGTAVLFQGVVQRLWLMQETEIENLKGLLAEASEELRRKL